MRIKSTIKTLLLLIATGALVFHFNNEIHNSEHFVLICIGSLLISRAIVYPIVYWLSFIARYELLVTTNYDKYSDIWPSDFEREFNLYHLSIKPNWFHNMFGKFRFHVKDFRTPLKITFTLDSVTDFWVTTNEGLPCLGQDNCKKVLFDISDSPRWIRIPDYHSGQERFQRRLVIKDKYLEFW